MMTVQSIEDSAPANAFPSTIKANINLFKKELIKYRNKFSQQLGEILPEVMFQKLEVIIFTLYRSPRVLWARDLCLCQSTLGGDLKPEPEYSGNRSLS